MPSRFIARASIPDPDTFTAHLRTVFTRAASEGIHISTGKGGGSALLRLSVEWGAKWAETSHVKATLALPVPVGPTDTERLKAAMARQGLTNATLGKLLGVSRDVVKNAVRGMAMGPALRTWLAANGGVE